MQKKNFIYAALCIGVGLLVSGCGKQTETPGITPTTAPVATVAPTQEAVDNTQQGEDKAPTVAPLENREITIYTINPDSLEKEAITVLVETEELTPELVVEQVVESMEDKGFIIGINAIITEGDSVTVDYCDDKAPVSQVGSSVEGMILDIIGQSILDNLPQYKKIYVSVMGKKYSSGHFEFELDEVYIGR